MNDDKSWIIGILITAVIIVGGLIGLVTYAQSNARDEELKTVYLIQRSFWAGYNTRMQGWPPQNISTKLFNSQSIEESRKILEIYSDLIESDKLPKNER